ncbi:glucuronate isomerase [Paenactinomyces guangxiensis]|uniref:Uronate isomerase n=1 Tax=Paenactinomyces guangxiensis TaxID=1490290 RepID=A0A7W1WP65_9BACL|nr:glucuronate isomerase [Paenactinomyces guangxiensis]MBA4493491.1 glucuronate isomerase [Paenactinomyces guangxiensis]MBH8590582.1 glucuronate isomerase [Paenactinomyces guangxiensis]
MITFIHEDFLLNNETAKVLYHEYAKQLPIIDYHCHLNPQEIAENKQFRNLTEIWLNGDHYKWRAMRSFGIDEKFITGDSDDWERFRNWAKTVPYCLGNPLYHWTHLELKRYFDVDILLNEDTSKEIWEHCNKLLQQENYRSQKIIERSNVEVVSTTDEPVDDLAYHQLIRKNEKVKTKVLPAFRPDMALEINQPTFQEFIKKLSEAAGCEITTFEKFLEALEKRIHYFHDAGCRISDHGIEYLPYEECSYKEASAIFIKGKNGEPVSKLEEDKYKTFTLLFLGKLYHSLDWVMQLHIGAIRNNSKRWFKQLGPNTGYDSIRDFELAKPLNQFLNALDEQDQLPKTILYNLNPIHNYVVASACGNFQTNGGRGKVQFGAGWWFNDQKDGMLKQMTDLANVGLLSTFVGMVTDSRSFLSYTRHEYFRRILCDLIGRWVELGEVPRDYKLLGELVQNICYYNAKNYFEIN